MQLSKGAIHRAFWGQLSGYVKLIFLNSMTNKSPTYPRMPLQFNFNEDNHLIQLPMVDSTRQTEKLMRPSFPIQSLFFSLHMWH